MHPISSLHQSYTFKIVVFKERLDVIFSFSLIDFSPYNLTGTTRKKSA